jgi:hypothetical protein
VISSANSKQMNWIAFWVVPLGFIENTGGIWNAWVGEQLGPRKDSDARNGGLCSEGRIQGDDKQLQSPFR